MLVKPYWQLTCIGLALLAPVAHAQEVGNDVPPSHWAYTAVKDLAGKGLIKGYPPDSKFLGARSLTRYELATILQRVIARVEETLAQPTVKKADLDKLQSSVDEIRALADEFKKELLVIGTDLNKVKDDIAALKGEVADLSKKVDAVDAKATAAQKAADDAAKKAATADQAAAQALENIYELKNNTNAMLGKKVDVNTGKLRIGGLIQVWGLTAFGKTPGGNSPLNTSSTPPGRNFGGGAGDTYRLRRGEIAFVGNINPKVDYRAMLDVAKIVTVSGGTSAAAPATTAASSNVLQDLWVGYQLAPRWRFEVGQQKTGLSEEGTRSSSALLTIERSIMNGLPTNAGRVGDIRDTGAILKFNNS